MLVSCRYCNGLHERGNACANRPKIKRTKEETYISKFRSTRIWQKKREEIKTRDKFLCQVCLLDKRYIFQKLSVHHITPISDNWSSRLNNSNLITLCRICHEKAENGIIKGETLRKIVREKSLAL